MTADHCLSNLQRTLIDRILEFVRLEGLGPGDRINEQQIALRLGVSRTPIRAALALLQGEGVVLRRPGTGVVLVKLPDNRRAEAESREQPPSVTREEALIIRIAIDRDRHELADEFTVVDLAERYGVARATLVPILEHLAGLGMVEKKPGYGWRFLTDWNVTILDESYRFRIVIEPAALLEPGFSVSAKWINDTRINHERFLKGMWTEDMSVAFFEANAAFHEDLAAASGNRFFREAVRLQSRVRRFAMYNWRSGRTRVEKNFTEHMAILDAVERGRFDEASYLMREHLSIAWKACSRRFGRGHPEGHRHADR
jgi:DNA-binding GntR family transcriptional regulator